jgi:inner membrane protein involved in colicin E2 resistance
MICQTQNDLWTRSLYIPCAVCLVQGLLFLLIQDFKEKLLVGYYQTFLFLVVPKYMFSIRFPTDVSEILTV